MALATTRYIGNGLIAWQLDIEAAAFYIGMLDDYLRKHNDKGVEDDRDALVEAVSNAKFIEDDE